MRITHQHIAEKVGVSRTVVTHVLHRTPNTRINTETREQILKVAQELGYQPRGRATHTIGYIMSPSQMRLEAEVSQMMLIEKSLRERGYRLTLASWQDDNPTALREIFNPKTVDGVFLNIWREGQVREVLAPQLPWILLSDEDGIDDKTEVVASDAFQTAQALGQHLIEYGHRRLGMVIGLPDIKFHRNAINGVREAMTQGGLQPESLNLVRPYYADEIAEELLAVMNQPGAPTAWIASTPGYAITTLYTLRSAGYQIPADVSLASLFDNERYQSLPPVITATNAQGTDFVELAVQRLFEKMSQTNPEPQQLRIPGEVIARQSVGKPAQSKAVNA